GLVEVHGGTVAAHSDGTGKGCEVVVYLPLLKEIPQQPEKDHQAGAPPSPRRVLVVDDNVDSAESMALLLRLNGHDVQTTYTGPAALEALTQHRPEIMLLDIGLPGMSGYEVAQQARQREGEKRVLLVAMTGYGQQDDRRRAKEAGFDHHL